MIAMIIALTALAIDIMLLTFGAVRSELSLAADSTVPAAIVTVFFLGLAAAQVFFGTLADRFGRKPVLYAGLAVYVVSALAGFVIWAERGLPVEEATPPDGALAPVAPLGG